MILELTLKQVNTMITVLERAKEQKLIRSKETEALRGALHRLTGEYTRSTEYIDHMFVLANKFNLNNCGCKRK